jgi:hypothetical protein
VVERAGGAAEAPKEHTTIDPKWWDESPCLTKEAAEWLVAKPPKVLGFDFAQEEKGGDYEKAEEILSSGMRVHRVILPKVVFQIGNLINLHPIPSKAKVIALPVKWATESAPARVIALLDVGGRQAYATHTMFHAGCPWYSFVDHQFLLALVGGAEAITAVAVRARCPVGQNRRDGRGHGPLVRDRLGLDRAFRSGPGDQSCRWAGGRDEHDRWPVRGQVQWWKASGLRDAQRLANHQRA